MVQALRLAGATEADLAQVMDERGEAPAEATGAEREDFAVEPDNWESWQVFRAVDTQWQWVAVGMGGLVRVALNHCALPGAMDMLGIARKRRADVYADVRLIERTVLMAENEMRARVPKGGRARTQGV